LRATPAKIEWIMKNCKWCNCYKSDWYIKCNDREPRRLEIQFPGKGKVDKWWWTQTDTHKRLLRCLSTTYSKSRFCTS
ncbi:MAG: hypothetical protein WCF07_14235, partial [Nitrososphaeraceae archaeon]